MCHFDLTLKLNIGYSYFIVDKKTSPILAIKSPAKDPLFSHIKYLHRKMVASMINEMNERKEGSNAEFRHRQCDQKAKLFYQYLAVAQLKAFSKWSSKYYQMLKKPLRNSQRHLEFCQSRQIWSH